jgi:hypothetical protein
VTRETETAHPVSFFSHSFPVCVCYSTAELCRPEAGINRQIDTNPHSSAVEPSPLLLWPFPPATLMTPKQCGSVPSSRKSRPSPTMNLFTSPTQPPPNKLPRTCLKKLRKTYLIFQCHCSNPICSLIECVTLSSIPCLFQLLE